MQGAPWETQLGKACGGPAAVAVGVLGVGYCGWSVPTGDGCSCTEAQIRITPTAGPGIGVKVSAWGAARVGRLEGQRGPGNCSFMSLGWSLFMTESMAMFMG